jgi:hypothetical protein
MLLTVVMTGKTFQGKICFSCTGGVFALDRYLLMGDRYLLMGDPFSAALIP